MEQESLSRMLSSSSRIIETVTTAENLRRLSQAVELESPILVQGEVGCGKSFLIRELAASKGLESTLVELHLDDQTDIKTLLGAYVCSDVPGEFLWQAGVITQAALNGRWLIIEDIDRAPLEVAASLSTLLERRRLYLPDRGKEVVVHPSFRIFGTRSIASAVTGATTTSGNSGTINVPSLRHFSYFWHFVTIDVPTNAEIKYIVTAKFPSLLPVVVQKLFETYGLFSKTRKSKLNRINRTSSADVSVDIHRLELEVDTDDGTAGATIGAVSSMTTRLFTLRDLMKAAHRCSSHSSDFNRASGQLTEEMRRYLLCEVIDVFAAAIRDRERERGVYNDLVFCLGRCWGVPDCDIDALILNAHPQMHRSEDGHRLENDDIQVRKAIGGNGNEEDLNGIVTVGRVTLKSSPVTDVSTIIQQFAFNRHSLRMLERLASCVAMDEPVLLVGETGSGKTTSIQELANMTRRKLVVQNLSLSTDASDLFGGFRPVSLRQLFLPSYEQFLSLFQETFSSSQNSEFVLVVAQAFRKQQWKKMLKAFLKASSNAIQKLKQQLSKVECDDREVKCFNVQRLEQNWSDFSDRSARFETNLSRIKVGFAFAFVDGLLVDAMRKGYWVLLDEINLAASETLQALAGVLDGQSLCLSERGDVEPVPRHKNFRIFAAMNPPTDVGKKELPIALRSRFTELYAEEVTDPQDLRHVVERVLADCGIPTSDEKQIDDIVSVYLGCRATADMTLADGAGQRPKFSLRSLTRSLKAVKGFIDIGLRPLNRAIFEGFLLNFYTLLGGNCRNFMWTFLKKSLGVVGGKKELAQPPPRPGGKRLEASDWVLVKPFWLRTGSKVPQDWAKKNEMGITRFVLTPTVEAAVRDLAAAVAAGVAPILLQGPTSVGKTSMIEYLAACTGHKCVRINNHEHTDVQEYVGGYITNDRGHLEFRDGLLVDALRNGYWIILDELNLAPSDVLEALNRLLDDNKELLIPETGETVRPQQGFSLFATQNPPGAYGGRKPLSRAFRNRFLELNISDLPSTEIEEIVTQSCGIAPKFSKMMVAVMIELQTRRQQSSLFQGKYGAVTTRDLIKWGRRQPQSPTEVAEEGYMLLAEKLRSDEEKKSVESVLNNVCKVQIATEMLYEYPIEHVEDYSVKVKSTQMQMPPSTTGTPSSSVAGGDLSELRKLQERLRAGEVEVEGVKGVAITASLRRLWRLTGRCVAHNEPVLLIGETGCGKTMGCQLLATHRGQRIRILNCHQSTETSDIIGGLRPVRGRSQLIVQAAQEIENALILLTDLKEVRDVVDVKNQNQSGEVEEVDKGDEKSFATIAHTFLLNIRILIPLSSIQIVDETQIRSALDQLNTFIKDATSFFKNPTSEEGEENGKGKGKGKDISPVPLKKIKRERGGVPVAAASEISKEINSEIGILNSMAACVQSAEILWQRSKSLFEWQDGPLVTAMKEGDMFVLDEINLAEDAVIERLNSALESGREITLAEKGGLSSEKIVAHPNFKFLATMNPGGDFGKRELSPALRSRFTEMWIPSANSGADIALIVAEILHLDERCGLSSLELSGAMVRFMVWLNRHSSSISMKGLQISVREVLAWAKFISAWHPLTMGEAYAGLLHGAHMVLLDGLGIGLSTPREIIRELKEKAVEELLNECDESVRDDVYRSVYPSSNSHPSRNIQGLRNDLDHNSSEISSRLASRAEITEDGRFTLGGVGFSISMGPNYFQSMENGTTKARNLQMKTSVGDNNYILTAQSVTENMRRILRAMQLPRPILLEGPPGVGKTSLISNLAKLTGHNLVRINLSEHSEISDLLGSDLPAPLDYDHEMISVENNVGTTCERNSSSSTSGPKFVWCDGVFLTALKKGDWVLLDELNLAPQSVLEGLNACLDHRGEVFLPEIGQAFSCPPSFRVFCAQNPAGEGGGRKGLPQSFLTRFSRVFVEEMDERDMRDIAIQAYSTMSDIAPSKNSNSSSSNSSSSESVINESKIFVEPTDQEIVACVSTLNASNSLVIHFLPQMVKFTRQLQSDIVDNHLYGNVGSPWEFNLRDIFRWCELIQSNSTALPLSGSALGVTSVEVTPHVVTATEMYILGDAAYMLFFSRLRTRADREGASRAFFTVFGWTPQPDYTPSIQLVGDSNVLIGLALLPKNVYTRGSGRGLGFNGEEGPMGYQSNPLLLAGLGKVVEVLAHCVALRWPALLIGQSGSGKRRSLRQLAAVTGTSLVEFSATASTDSTDLLGSFEQASAYRHLRFGLEFLDFAAGLLLPLREILFGSTVTPPTAGAYEAVSKAILLHEHVQRDAEVVIVTASLRLKLGGELFGVLQDTLQAISNALVIMRSELSISSIMRNMKIADAENDLILARNCFDKCYHDCNSNIDGKGGEISGFEWVDGVVVTALKNGHWLLIDNVNLCPASVLDRLNSLLEPNGTLLLTESGAGTILIPHADFRIFFAMDPSHGEISRAMRNRCVEMSMLMEGDCEVAAAYLLSLTSSSSIPLLPSTAPVSVTEGFTDVNSQSLLVPLCDIYGLLAAPVSEVEDSTHKSQLLDVKGSLSAAGLSAAVYPRFRMFARLTRLVAIECRNGKNPRESLQSSVKSVLPFFSIATLASTDSERDDIDKTKGVRNMSVDEDSVGYSGFKNPDSASVSSRILGKVLSSPPINLLPCEVRANLVLLVALSTTLVLKKAEAEGEGIRSEGLAWLQRASRSVRDRSNRDYSAFVLGADARSAQIVRKEGDGDVEAANRALVDADGLAFVTTLQILSEMEDEVLCTDFDQQISLEAFIMALLVRSSAAQSGITQTIVHSLLIDAGFVAQALSFSYWISFTMTSPQLELLTPTIFSNILSGSRKFFSVPSSVSASALHMLLGRKDSTSSSLGAVVAAVSLSASANTGSSSSIRALEFATTCVQLLDIAIFDRWIVLDEEYRQRCEVDNAISLSSDSNLPSLFALAYALHRKRIVADSSELQVLLSVYAALLVADMVLSNITQELSTSSPTATHNSDFCLSARSMHILRKLLDRRDMLSRVLSSCSAPSDRGAMRIPWEEIIVCVRWVKKGVSALMDSVQHSLKPVSMTKGREVGDSDNNGDAFLKICTTAHIELSQFDRALGEYWNRPVLLGMNQSLSLTLSSATSKLRLWKEGGHAAVPSRLEEWCTLQALRRIVQPIKRRLPSFVDTQIDTVQVVDDGSSVCPTSLRREWLCLYSTFYWMHTNESSSCISAYSNCTDTRAPTLVPSQSRSIDVKALVTALQSQFTTAVGGDKTSCSSSALPQMEMTANSGESDMYGDADYPLLADKEAAERVRDEWRHAGELSVSILLEPIVISSLFGICNSLSVFMKHHSVQTVAPIISSAHSPINGLGELRGRTEELQLLSAQLSSIVSLAVRYTLFDLGDFRELQTLLWSVEAVLTLLAECSMPVVNVKKAPKNAKKLRDIELFNAEKQFLSLARVFSVQFEVRLNSLLTNNLVCCMDAVNFTYSSPTLKAILEPTLDGPNLQSGLGPLGSLTMTQVTIPWSWTLSTGMLRLLQPTGIETALRHVDARALYSHSIAGAGTVSALVGGGAVVTVATCGNALGRLLQLFRLTATTSAPPCASLMRLRLLGQHTTDVLTSIRDFLTVEGYSHISEVIVRKYADNSDACAFYQELLDLNIAGMSNSSYIAELLTTCLYPILDVLANEELRMKPLENVPQIGRSWMLVGLLRLYLVLPQTPVDPATKSAVKAQLLSVETQLKKIQMHATHLQAVLSGKPHVTTHMASTAVLVRTVEQQVTELSARAVQRPVDAPHFEEVFAELRGACDGLANIDRILALDSRTTEAYAELQQSCRSWVEATKHVGSHGRKGTKEHSVNIEKARVAAAVAFDALTVCAREELGWQGSVSAFIERCGAQFSMYEDVTSPVIAAMHNLSSGVRLSVGWCYGQAEDLMLALSHSQTARQSDGLLGKKTGETQYSASEVIARGWKGVLMYPHSSSICLSGTRGDQVSAEALKCVHSLLQCSDLLAARAFKSISDMRSAQGELKTRTKIAPNPLLIDKICPQAALLLSLARLDYLVGGGTAACSSAKGLFRQVLERFVHAYLKAEDDRKKQAALKAALYQNKAEEKVFESDDVKEELVALRLHFPDHLSEFRDITDTARGPDGETLGQLRDEDDDEVMEKENVDIDTENEECELSLSVDPQTAALLVGYHCRMVFLHITQQLKAVGKLWVLEGQQCRTVHVGQREALDSALTSCSLMTAKGLEWGLRRLLSPGSEGALRGGAMNALSFMTEKCNPSTWGTGRSSSSSSSSVSWIERLTGISTTQVSHGKGNRRKIKRRKGVTSETAAEAAVSKIDRDLLLLLDPSAEGSWHPKDFNADPHPEEVMLAAEPLRKLFDRATEVLQLYPGNELLVQVCKVAARISELHTSTPVGKLLMTVQLLLVKAQEWEQFAAMHVSLHVEMAGLSVLIGRWRELELKSWGQLLRCKEQSYVQTAMMYWFSLARSLNSHPQIEASTAVTEVSSKDAEVERKRREQWPGLADVTPNWLCAGFISESKEGLGTGPSSLFEGLEDVLEQSKISAIPLVKMELSALATPKIQDPTDARTGSIYGDADGTAAHSRVFAKKFLNDASKREKMTRENYLSNIFEILNSFLKRAVVGEFPTRLHLVRLFALQLHQDTIPECNATSTATAAATATIIVLDDVDHEGGGGEVDGVGEGIESSSMPPSLKRQLARMVMGVWRYYQQFLSVVRRFQDILREPIERRLKGEVKIGKWDQLSTYGLIEHSERVHKKLNKFIREYQGDVLEYPISAVLRRDLIGDLASEGGDLKASTAVPPAASVFPMLKCMGELLHLQTISLPARKPAAASQIERQREHEENISAMVLDEQIEEEKDGGRGRKKVDDIEEEEEEDEVEVDYVADCAEELLSVSSSAPSTHSVTPSDTSAESAVNKLLSQSVIMDMSKNSFQSQFQDLALVADTHPKLLASSTLCGKMDKYLRGALIMRVAESMTRTERKEKDPSYFLLSARYQGKARFGLQGAELAEGLCEDIFHRIENLRAEGVPKSAKQRAVGDLLRKMREEGVSHLKSLVPLEIRQSVQLLSVPPPLACEIASDLFWSSATGSLSDSTSSDVFQKAETYFTRGIAELDQLRVQAAAPSAHDISSREAQLMVATAENLFCSALRLRCALSAGMENRRISLKTLQRLQELATIPLSHTTQTTGEELTAGSLLSLKKERTEYTVRAGCVILDNLVQIKKLLKTAATAHESQYLEDAPATATINMSTSAIQHTAQSINRAVQTIDHLISAVQSGNDKLSDLVVIDAKSRPEKNLSLYDALAVAEQEKKDAVWYASFGSYHLPPSSTGNSTSPLSVTAAWSACAAAALREVESVKDSLCALLSADVTTPTIARLQEYVLTLQQFSTSEGIAEESLPKSSTVYVESKSIKSLSLLIDESLITVQRIRAIAERTGKYRITGTAAAGKVTGCFGEVTILTNSTSTDPQQQQTSSEVQFENRGNEQGEMRLTDLLSMGMTSFSALQTHKLTAHVSALCDNLSNLSYRHDDCDMNLMAHHTLLLVQQTACPLVAKVLGAEAVLLRDLCESYKSCGKLLYVLLRVFRVLLAKGLCSDETKEGEGGGGEGERKFEDDVEGTGMGEGEGKKDVSDQIENEEQLLGLKDDTPKEDKGEQKQESKELSEEEKDKGVEMSQDFEGDMFDIPEDKDQDERDDNQEDDEEEVDREMGDANPEDIVDEKQWDREADGEGPEDGEEKEKFEEGSKMDGEKLEGETRTRDDKEGEKEKEKKKDETEKDTSGDADDVAEDEEDGNGNDENDNENGGKINEDNDEDTTDKPLGVDVRKEEKVIEENEDGGEIDEEEGDQGDGVGGEEQQLNEAAEGEDLPDDMNLDGGSDDDGENGGKGEEEDDLEGGEDSAMDLEPDSLDGTDKMPDDEVEDEEEDINEAMQASGGGNIGEDQAEKDDAEEDDKKEGEDAEAEEGAPPDSIGDDKKYAAPAFGVKAQGGKDSVLGTEEDEDGPGGADDKDKEVDENQGKEDPSSSEGKSGSKGAEGSSQGKGKEGEIHETSDGQRQEGDPQSKNKERDPPNPFKQRGDINKAWHRRLNMVAPEEEEGDEEDRGMAEADDPIDEESGGQGLYEHDKDGGGTEQVLADISEEEAFQIPLSGEQSDKQGGGEDEEMAIDRDGTDQRKPRKDEKKRDRKRKDDKEPGDSQESEEASRLKKKLRQEQDAERKQRLLDEGLQDEDNENLDDHLDPEDLGTADGSSERDEATKELKEEDMMNLGGIGGKAYTNTRDVEKRSANDQTDDCDNDDEGIVLDIGNDLRLGEALMSSARLQWSKHRAATESHAMRLCEQLRLVLEPTLATRLQGDYRTGKRINMRRVVGYVASGFRKDKIWLRRTKPAKREYQVMVMIDNSSSMGEAGPIALSALATLSTALTRLEVGQLCVAAFASGVQMVHPFGQPFDDEAGARAMDHFTFEAERTLLGASLEAVAPVFSDAKSSSSTGGGNGSVVLQLCFVISDARIDSDNRSRLDSVVRSFAEQNVLVVLIVIDKSLDPKDSIFNTRTVEFKGDKVVTSAYLDDFPFPYYVAIQRLEALPEVLSDALKQWFEIVGDQLSAAAGSK